MSDRCMHAQFTVNGESVQAQVPVRMHLVDYLREEMGLTGSHLGCEHGVCGACQVMVDGQVVRGCLTLAIQADGKHVQTIEGLTENRELQKLQAAFLKHNAFQCGFCSAGMLLTALDITQHHKNASREEIKELISGRAMALQAKKRC